MPEVRPAHIPSPWALGLVSRAPHAIEVTRTDTAFEPPDANELPFWLDDEAISLDDASVQDELPSDEVDLFDLAIAEQQ
jgi:hypothetical protein